MGFGILPTPEITSGAPVMDMAPILKRIPPIKGVFSPDKEAKRLWSVPKARRKEAVESFKDKFFRQQEAWMLCRTSIEERINANPDLPKKEMVGIIREFASHYGFPKDHIKRAEALVDGYITMHKRVKKIRKDFPDDLTLIEKLTGVKFPESAARDFKVKTEPMAIEIECSGANAGKIYKRSEAPVTGFAHAGFIDQSKGEKPVYYLVITRGHTHYSPVLIHEREHLKKRLLGSRSRGVNKVSAKARERLDHGVSRFLRIQIDKALLGFERSDKQLVLDRYELAKNPKEKAFWLAEYMEIERETALDRVKSELFAMKAELKAGYRYLDYNIFKDPGSDYDYLGPIIRLPQKKGDRLWRRTAQRILVDEYEEIIDRAIVAFDRLMAGGYKPEEVIALLSDKRLPEWPKTAKRLLGQKERRRRKG